MSHWHNTLCVLLPVASDSEIPVLSWPWHRLRPCLHIYCCLVQSAGTVFVTLYDGSHSASVIEYKIATRPFLRKGEKLIKAGRLRQSEHFHTFGIAGWHGQRHTRRRLCVKCNDCRGIRLVENSASCFTLAVRTNFNCRHLLTEFWSCLFKLLRNFNILNVPTYWFLLLKYTNEKIQWRHDALRQLQDGDMNIVVVFHHV